MKGQEQMKCPDGCCGSDDTPYQLTRIEVEYEERVVYRLYFADQTDPVVVHCISDVVYYLEQDAQVLSGVK
jgi:hypothetical protein